MATEPVLRSWESFFPGLPPVGFLLRKNHPEQWLRFHTLPGAKRVPQNELEAEEVLQRMKQLSEALFQPGSPVALWITSFSHPRPSLPEGQWTGFEAVTQPPPAWASALREYVDVAHMNVWVHTREWDWEHTAFFFREVSMDRLDSVTAWSAHTGAALCPYDGGIDVFVVDADKRDALKRRFKSWLP